MIEEQITEVDKCNSKNARPPLSTDIIFEINDLKKYYPVTAGFFRKNVGYVKALEGVSVTINRGETLGVVGESGCGKTTFGKTMMMLQRPTAGKLLFHFPEGIQDLTALGGKDLMPFRKRVQMIFQDPYSALNPSKKVFDAFDEPLLVHGHRDPKERKEKIVKSLEMVNLKADYMYRYPHEFSGGQRQRICIARALCIGPEMVICDEPVSALDVSVQAQVLNLMKDLQKELGLTYVFIAHDLSVVQYMSDKIMVMYLGRIVEMADSSLLYDSPLHPYTQALLSAVPVPSIDAKRKRIILQGDVPSPINEPSGCPFHPRCRNAVEICKNTQPELKLAAKDSNHWVACHLASSTNYE
ncbi:MAG TPA: dipeptide ABC transporter ATP-binding protein [Spirochaetales bacterium]|nr:dipeptide ABC transporter ATP-binding protein [Spirochaetales bacterium]